MSNKVVIITENAIRNGIGAAYKARSDISRYGLEDTGIRIMHSFDDPDINTWHMYAARVEELRDLFPEVEPLIGMEKYTAAEKDSNGSWNVLSQDKGLSAVKNKISEGFVISILEKQDTESWKTCLREGGIEGQASNVMLSTTPSLEGYTIDEYKGIVCGEVIIGLNMLRDFAAGITNVFGGRSLEYEEPLSDARDSAMREMSERAIAMNANAVVGVDIDYEVLGSNNGMLMVSTSGTAVVVTETKQEE